MTPRFAKGGIVPGASCGDDRVPVMLRQGCVLVSREQAEQMGLRVDWEREHPEGKLTERTGQ